MATPARGPPPGGLKTPSGRFWIGKSGWPLAEATQLRELRVVGGVERGIVHQLGSGRLGSNCFCSSRP